jgi:hypothetical protein
MPGLHLVTPARWRGIVLLAVALLAGYGLDRYLYALANKSSYEDTVATQLGREQILRRWRWILGTLAVGSALGALTAWGVLSVGYEQALALGQAQVQNIQTNPLTFRTTEEYMALAQQRLAHLLNSFHPTHWPTYLPLWIAVLLAGVQRLLIQRSIPAPRRRAVMGGLILLLVLGELWRVAYDYNPSLARTDVFPTPPLIEELRQHATEGSLQPNPFRVVGINRVLMTNVNMVFGLEDVRGYEPSGALRYHELMSRVDGVTWLFPILLFHHAQSQILDFLNVRYAFSDVPLAAPWEAVAQQGSVTLYSNPEVLPRAFLVYAVQPARTRDESLALTLAPDFDPRHDVVLEVANDAEMQALASLPKPASPGRSAITHYAPGEIVVDVEGDADGILVLSESYVSGWKATVDGVNAPLYVANHAFHAIAVPAGRHTVAFTYAPTSVTVGVWISIGCLVILLALLLWPRRA